MPVKNYLTTQQKEILQRELKTNQNPAIRERILILLLHNDGKTQREIANFLGCSIRKVAFWCVHGDPDNLESFKDERMKGNYRKATEEYISLLLETLEKEPEEFGYEFGRWTAERLAAHLERETGISLSSSQVRRILKSKKYVYIWGKYSLEDRQDPEKRKIFKEKLDEYIRLTKEEPETYQVWFWDESGFSLDVINRKNWGAKGKRKKIAKRKKRGRVNIMGAVRFSDKKRLVDFVSKGTGETFYEVLKGFYEEIKIEWVEKGNSIEQFEKKGPKIVIILDNASIHKKKEFVEKIKEEMQNIILEFLPTYSPDYNIAELVWHSAKEFIAHRLFKSIEELEALLNRLLNDGELFINWGRNLKNKGNMLNAI